MQSVAPGASRLVIAVDGPAAAGKGTLARGLGEALGLPHLDTGLLYRAVARRMLDAGLDPAADAEAAARALRPGDLARGDLRTPDVDRAASRVAGQGPVRSVLLEFQRTFGARHGAVLDGRDIGTVIFPDAAVKFFLTASIPRRAERRWRQLGGGHDTSPELGAEMLARIAAELAARDEADAARAAAPLRPAADAVQIDTDQLDAPAVLEQALCIVRKRYKDVRT